MTKPFDLMKAILSMDAYDQGYAPGIGHMSGTIGWEIIAPFLLSDDPPPIVGGLKRGHGRRWPMRSIVDAIFYVLRDGVPWRSLPKDFPPWKTVYH